MENSSPRNQKDYRALTRSSSYREIRKNMSFITQKVACVNPNRGNSPRNQKTHRAPDQKFIIPNNQKKHDIYHPKSSMRKPPHGKFITRSSSFREIRKIISFITQKVVGVNPYMGNSSPRNQKACRAPHQTFITQKLEKT